MKATCTGTSSSATTIRKIESRNGNRDHENAYAAIDARVRGRSVDGMAMIMLLMNAWPMPWALRTCS